MRAVDEEKSAVATSDQYREGSSQCCWQLAQVEATSHAAHMNNRKFGPVLFDVPVGERHLNGLARARREQVNNLADEDAASHLREGFPLEIGCRDGFVLPQANMC